MKPEQASCTRRLPADRRCGATSALARSRPTSGKSPVRESRTPGSVRGAGRNPCPYRDNLRRCIEAQETAQPFQHALVPLAAIVSMEQPATPIRVLRRADLHVVMLVPHEINTHPNILV